MSVRIQTKIVHLLYKIAKMADTTIKKEFGMEKKCSIRLLLLGMILSAVFSLSAGFFAGSQKSWKTYEERIVLLQQQNAALLAQQESAESEKTCRESKSGRTL